MKFVTIICFVSQQRNVYVKFLINEKYGNHCRKRRHGLHYKKCARHGKFFPYPRLTQFLPSKKHSRPKSPTG